MKNNLDKKIGLWLDHSKAHFIDFSKGPAVIETAYSDKESQLRFAGEDGTDTRVGTNRTTDNEHHQHNREQNHINDYYNLLTDRLKNYDDILLFGSSTAKDELFNRLKSNKHFAEKSITVKPADQLTENQMIAEGKKFFKL